MKVIIFIIISFFNLAQASGEKTVEIKKGGAISAFSQEDGFKLSDKAIKNLGVSFQSLKGSAPWSVPREALVRVKYSTGVYRMWDGWITMVLVKVIAQNKSSVTIMSIDLEPQDQIAITGVPFLRMTDLDLNSDTVDTCSH